MTQYTVVGREATTTDPTARPDLIFETADSYITVGAESWRIGPISPIFKSAVMTLRPIRQGAE